MAKPGFLRNLGGAIVNGLLSPGTTPYGANGQYNRTLLRNGAINLAAGAVNPLAGQAAQFATNRWGGGAGQEAGQQGWNWMANQSIGGSDSAGLPYRPTADFAPVNPVNLPADWMPETGGDNPVPDAAQQAPPLALSSLGGGPRRDTRSGSSAGSHVLAEGEDAQNMVGSMQLANFLAGPQKGRAPGPKRTMQS